MGVHYCGFLNELTQHSRCDTTKDKRVVNHDDLERIAQEIMDIFEIFAPPVPIELMLQHPRNGMWEQVDPTQLSGSFLSIKDRYSPRMSLTRLLVRHVASSDWGKERGLFALLKDQDQLAAFARMIIMPRDMVQGLTANQRNPETMSTYFEVPREDVEIRLDEVF
jgi:hypothetical protein